MSVLSPSMANKPMPARTVQRYRWPSERHLVPTRCGHDVCGGALVLVPPTVDDPLSDASCINCARVGAELVADGFADRRLTPAQFKALPTLPRSGGPRPKGVRP